MNGQTLVRGAVPVRVDILPPAVSTAILSASARAFTVAFLVAAVVVTAAPLLLAQSHTAGVSLASQPATLGEVRSVLESIPTCSGYLRQPSTFEGQARFVPAMRAQGVARAAFVIGADALWPEPRGLRVLHVLYFDEYDGPDPEITDPSRLRGIAATGLAAALRARALSEARQLREATHRRHAVSDNRAAGREVHSRYRDQCR